MPTECINKNDHPGCTSGWITNNYTLMCWCEDDEIRPCTKMNNRLME